MRDEADFIATTIASVAAQERRPAEWVIVDDGSTDGTAEILDVAKREHDWIRVVRRPDRGERVAGSGVMEAFHAGIAALVTADWEFLVKLDGDLRLPPSYFAQCLDRFGGDQRLGIGGGLVVDLVDGRRRLERHPAFHVRGATKIYRRACWQAIGGTVVAPGWDTLDEVTACMLGWTTRTFEQIEVVQLRGTGAPVGRWADVSKNGKASYRLGYHPLFVAVRAVRKLGQRPLLVGSLALLWGFAVAAIRGEPRIGSADVRRYLREQQLRRVTFRSTAWR